MNSKKPRITKAQLNTIVECLAAGIPLTLQTKRGERRILSGEITGTITRGWADTTLPSQDMMSTLQLGPIAIANLYKQAVGALARKDDVLAKKEASFREALDLS